MYHIGYNEKNERNIQAWLEQSQRSQREPPHGERQWVHEISDDEEAMSQIPSVFHGSGSKAQNTPPLDLSVFEKGPRQAESPLDLSVKTRKRCADSTEIEELHRRRGVHQSDAIRSKRLCMTQIGEQRQIPNYPYDANKHSDGQTVVPPPAKPAGSKYQYMPTANSPLVQSSQTHVASNFQSVQGYPARGGLSPAGQARQVQMGQYQSSRARQVDALRSFEPGHIPNRSLAAATSSRRGSAGDMKVLQSSETTALQGFYEPSGKHTLTVSPSTPDFLQTKRAPPVEQPVLVMQDQTHFQGNMKRTEPIHQRLHQTVQHSSYPSVPLKQTDVTPDPRSLLHQQQQQQKQIIQQRELVQQMAMEQRSPVGHDQQIYNPYSMHQTQAMQKATERVDRERIAMIPTSNMIRETQRMDNSGKHISVPLRAETVLHPNTHLAFQQQSAKNVNELRNAQTLDRSRTYPQINAYGGQEVRSTRPIDNSQTLRQSYFKTEQRAYPGYGGSKVISQPQPSLRTNIQSNVVSPGSRHIGGLPLKHDSRPEMHRPQVAHPGHSVIQRQSAISDSRHLPEKTPALGTSQTTGRPNVQNLMYERRTISSSGGNHTPRYNIEHRDNRVAPPSKDLAYMNRMQALEPSAPKSRQLAFHTSRGREISLVSNSPEILPTRTDPLEANIRQYDSTERRLSREHRLSFSHQASQNSGTRESRDSHNIDMSQRLSFSSQSSRNNLSTEMQDQSKHVNTNPESVKNTKAILSDIKKPPSAKSLFSEASNARIASEMILPMAQKLGLERSITKGTSGLHKDIKNFDFMSNIIAEELKKDTEPPEDCFKNRSVLDEIDRSANSSPVKHDVKNETKNDKEIPESAKKEDAGEFKNPPVPTVTSKTEPASYTLPLQIAIPGNKSGTRGSVISSVQSEKAPKLWSRKHMILSQFKHDEDLKNTVNIDQNEKIPIETAQFATKKGSEKSDKSQNETLSICPPSPKMPILSPQEKQRITPMVSPATGDPPNLDESNSASNSNSNNSQSNTQSQPEQTPAKEIKSLEQYLHKLISDGVKSQGSSFDKDKVCETVFRLTSQPQPHKPFISRQLSASKNIPVANVAPFVHDKFAPGDYKVSETGEGASSQKPETEVKIEDDGEMNEEKKSQDTEVVDEIERSTSLGKYSSFESPSQQDVVCNFVNVDIENKFKPSDIDLEHSNSSFSTQNFSTLFDDDSNDLGISPGPNEPLFQKLQFGTDLDSNKNVDSLGFISNMPKVSTSPKQEVRNVFGAFDEILSEARMTSDGEVKYDSEEEESLLSEFKLDSNAGYEGDDEGKRDKLVKGKTKQSNTRQKADKLVKKARLSKNLKVDGSKNTVKSRLQKKTLIQKGFVDFMPEVLPQRTRTERAARPSLRSGKDPKAKAPKHKRQSSHSTVKGKKSTSADRRSSSLGRSTDVKSKSALNPGLDSESVLDDKFAYFSDRNELDTGIARDSLKGVPNENAKWRIKPATASSNQTAKNGKGKGGLMVKLSLRALQQADDESTDEEYFQNYEDKFKTFASDNDARKDTKKSSASKKKKGFHFKQKYIFQKKRRPKTKTRIPQTDLQPTVLAHQLDLDDLYSFHEEGYDLLQPQPSASQEFDAASYIPVPAEVKRMTVNKDTGETLLHRAARMGYVEVTLYCLATGNVDVNARDNAGYTPLHECCVRGHRAVAIQLLKYGADVNCCSVDGIRPIHDAVENDRVEMVRLLLSYGADPTIATYAGRTPLKITRTERMKHMLLCYIADLNGYTPELDVEENPWQFHSSSNTLDTQEEEGSAVFFDIPSDPEDETADLCSLSNQPVFPTQRITAEGGKRTEDYILLEDILRGYRVSKKEFESQGIPSHMIKSLTKQAVMNSKKDSICYEYFSSKSDNKGIKAIRCVDATQIVHKMEKLVASSSSHGSHRTKS